MLAEPELRATGAEPVESVVGKRLPGTEAVAVAVCARGSRMLSEHEGMSPLP